MSLRFQFRAGTARRISWYDASGVSTSLRRGHRCDTAYVRSVIRVPPHRDSLCGVERRPETVAEGVFAHGVPETVAEVPTTADPPPVAVPRSSPREQFWLVVLHLDWDHPGSLSADCLRR